MQRTDLDSNGNKVPTRFALLLTSSRQVFFSLGNGLILAARLLESIYVRLLGLRHVFCHVHTRLPGELLALAFRT